MRSGETGSNPAPGPNVVDTDTTVFSPSANASEGGRSGVLALRIESCGDSIITWGGGSRGWRCGGRRSKYAPAGLLIEQAFRTGAEESPEPSRLHTSNKWDPQSAKASVIEYNPKVQFPWRASALGASRVGCIG